MDAFQGRPEPYQGMDEDEAVELRTLRSWRNFEVVTTSLAVATILGNYDSRNNIAS